MTAELHQKRQLNFKVTVAFDKWDGCCIGILFLKLET